MLIAQRPTLTEESINPQRSRFVIEPLEPVSDTRLVIRCAAHC